MTAAEHPRLESGGVVALDRILAIEEIKTLKIRYARCVDRGQWQELKELLTDDAVHEHPAFGRLEGRELIVARLAASLSTTRATHIVAMPEINLLDATTAEGLWSAIVQTQRSDEAGDWVDDGRTEYHERYRKGSDGAWRFTYIRNEPLTRISRLVTAGAPA